MKHIIIVSLLVLLLTACVDPTPTPPPEIDADVEVIIISAPVATQPAAPRECDYGIQSWVRYPVIPVVQSQEVSLAVDYCEEPVEGQLVTVCVASVCHKATTDQYGQAEIDGIKPTWRTGSVPVSICINDTPVCLSYSFMAVQP